MAISANVFHKGAETIFKVFANIAYTATYTSVVSDPGFDGSAVTETNITVDVILDTFAERDVQFLSFSALIQPTDVKGLVRGRQLQSVDIGTSDRVTIGEDVYTVIAYSTDPASAVYTLLLRKV